MDELMMEEFKGIANEFAVPLNNWLALLLDSHLRMLPPNQRPLYNETTEERLQRLVNSTGFGGFHEEVLQKGFAVYAGLVQRVLQTLTGVVHSAESFLSAAAVQRLTAGRLFVLHKPEKLEDWPFALFAREIDASLPKIAHLPTLDGLEVTESAVRVKLSSVNELRIEFGKWLLLPNLQLDAKEVTAIWTVNYVAFVLTHLSTAAFDAYPELRTDWVEVRWDDREFSIHRPS